MALKRDQILEAKDIRTQRVKVPEWAVDGEDEVIISSMSGAARDAWEQSFIGSKKGTTIENVRARLLVYCLVDEDGNRLFTEADVEVLGRKSAGAMERCVKVAQKLNRLTEGDLEDAKGN